jgi:hypothetical protein
MFSLKWSNCTDFVLTELFLCSTLLCHKIFYFRDLLGKYKLEVSDHGSESVWILFVLWCFSGQVLKYRVKGIGVGGLERRCNERENFVLSEIRHFQISSCFIHVLNGALILWSCSAAQHLPPRRTGKLQKACFRITMVWSTFEPSTARIKVQSAVTTSICSASHTSEMSLHSF